MTAEIIFWCAAVFLLYTHAGYPLLLWIRVRFNTAKDSAVAGGPAVEPMVSILVVAYNEAARIEARLDNLLALDYPRERLEIILASDGSSDDTAARVQRYIASGLKFIAYDGRRGKISVL